MEKHTQEINIQKVWIIAENLDKTCQKTFFHTERLQEAETQEQNQKSPNRAETGFAKAIHKDIVNNTYFNMTLNNEECAKFCCELLKQLNDICNQYITNKGKEIRAFVALCNLKQRYTN